MRAIALWFRALFRRSRVEAEMRREMRHHLDMEIAEHVRRGMSEDEARRTALLAFGGVANAEEGVRDERRTRVIENLIGDVRYALRGFARQPGYALMIVALLAIGIGGNTALFSVVYHELISPLPYADGDRMVELLGTGGQGNFLIGIDQTLADAWQREARTVEQVTIMGYGRFTIGDTASTDPTLLDGAVLGPGASRFIGRQPELGRDITARDTLAGAAPVALISDSVWRHAYAGDPSVLGRRILVDGVQHTIIGVVPADYQMPFTNRGNLFLGRRPLPPNPTRTDRLLRGAVNDAEPLAKLRPGVSVADANRELAAIFARWAPSPDGVRFANEQHGVVVDPPHVERAVDAVQRWLRDMVLLLFGAMSFVLLIACANVANLLLVRAWSRQRELAVRAAMGAGRGRLVMQVLTESVLLAVVGAAAGVGVASVALHAILHSTLGKSVAGARLEPAVLAWCAGVAILTGLLFGAAPARFAAEGRVTEALKAGARAASSGKGARRFRAALVGLEIALSVMLLAGAGLLVRSLVAMQRADIGIDTRGLSSIQVYFPRAKLSASGRAAAFQAIGTRLAGMPGVQSVALSEAAPLDPQIWTGGVSFEDRPASASDSLSGLGFNSVEPAYFDRMGMQLSAGRVFLADPRDTDIARFDEVMVNDRFARRFWPGGSAVGKRIKMLESRWSTIVGVVHDVDIPGVNNRIKKLQVYVSMPAAPTRVAFNVRSTLSPSTIEPLLRSVVHQTSPVARVEEFVVANDAVAAGRALQRSMLVLLGIFAAVALLLAAIGLHAVIAFSVSQRTREIGMRVALGAESRDVLRLVVGQGLGIAVVGVGCGSIGALAATGALRAYLYGVQSNDLLTLATVAACLLLTAVLATLPPALRASRLDPVEALRAD